MYLAKWDPAHGMAWGGCVSIASQDWRAAFRSCSAGKEIAPGGNGTIAIKYAPANKATSTAHVTLTGRGGREEKLHSESFYCN